MTNPNPGKVPLTVYVDPPPEGMEWYEHWYRNAGQGEDAVALRQFKLRPIVPATVKEKGL